MFQIIILTASAEQSAHMITEPCSTAREFFEQKNVAAVKVYLYYKLAIDNNFLIHLPAGLPTASHSGVLFWESIGYPSNFCFFLVHVQSVNIFSDR